MYICFLTKTESLSPGATGNECTPEILDVLRRNHILVGGTQLQILPLF